MIDPLVAILAIPACAGVIVFAVSSLKEVVIARSPAGVEAERQAGITNQVSIITDMPTTSQPLALEALALIHGPDSDELPRQSSVREIR